MGCHFRGSSEKKKSAKSNSWAVEVRGGEGGTFFWSRAGGALPGGKV